LFARRAPKGQACGAGGLPRRPGPLLLVASRRKGCHPGQVRRKPGADPGPPEVL